MSSPKRHHYLPQFYLKGFSRDDHLWVFDRKTKQFRRQTPQNTAIETHYYSVENNEGEKKTDIESFLAYIEGITLPIFERIFSSSEVSAEDKQILSIFIAFLMNRVPDFEKSINKVEEHIMQRMMDLMFSDEKRAESIMKRYEKDTGEKSKVTPKEMVDFHKLGAYKIEIHRNESLRLMLELSMDIANFFQQMDWVFFHTPTKTSFVTSDNPVVLVPPEEWDPKSFYGVGLITPGAKKVIPINKEVCLVMYDHGERIIHADLSTNQVRRININIAIRTDRFLIGRDETLIRNLVKFTKLDQWEAKSRIQIG